MRSPGEIGRGVVSEADSVAVSVEKLVHELGQSIDDALIIAGRERHGGYHESALADAFSTRPVTGAIGAVVRGCASGRAPARGRPLVTVACRRNSTTVG